LTYLELAHLDTEAERCPGGHDPWTHGLLIRCRRADRSLAFVTTWYPKGPPIEVAAGVEGHRWAIEDAFDTAKTELGLDHNETRNRHGWHHHVSLVMLAFALLAVIRQRADAVRSPQERAAAERRPRWRARPSRRFGGLRTV
jgi:SRSO17 transposase